MLINELKGKIDELEKKNKDLLNEADSLKEQLIMEIKLYASCEIKSLIENEVKKQPEKTKDLGKEKLGAMKQELNSLLEKLDNKIGKILSKSEYWIHCDKKLNDIRSTYQSKRDAEDLVIDGIKEILGLGGKILVDYKYCEAKASYDRSNYGSWCYNYEDPLKTIKCNYGPALNKTLNDLLNKYSGIIENIISNNAELDNLTRRLNEQEAINMWEEI